MSYLVGNVHVKPSFGVVYLTKHDLTVWGEKNKQKNFSVHLNVHLISNKLM